MTLFNGLYLRGDMPEAQPNAPTWLKELPADFLRKAGANTSITDLNDEEGFTFDEIADVIELVYVHRAL